MSAQAPTVAEKQHKPEVAEGPKPLDGSNTMPGRAAIRTTVRLLQRGIRLFRRT